MAKATVSGAVCKCNAGSAPSALLGTVSHVCIGGKVAAAISDLQFFAPFGTCDKLEVLRGTKPVFCEYAPAAGWIQPLGSIQFGASPLLSDGAVLKCVHGGEIRILEAGQGLTCVWEAVTETGASGKLLAGLPILGGIAVADGPLPFGDGAAVLGGLGLLGLGVLASATSEGPEGGWVLEEEYPGQGYDEKYGHLEEDYAPPERDSMTGGKKGQRDDDFGIRDQDFWEWWHRKGKQGRDLGSRQEAEEAYAEWEAAGKPRR